MIFVLLTFFIIANITNGGGGGGGGGGDGVRTGLVVRALDSGSGDPGSILSRVGVCCFLEQRNIYSPKVLVIPRNRWLRLNMTEKLFTGTLNNNETNKQMAGWTGGSGIRGERRRGTGREGAGDGEKGGGGRGERGRG